MFNRRTRSSRDVSSRPPPDEASLREAATSYVARYAATETGLKLVLFRRIDRWARQAAGMDNANRDNANRDNASRDTASDRAAVARAMVPAIVARMVELGLLNDAAFAESRAQGLALTGRSRRAITARLMAKGIGSEQARSALAEDEGGELVSALILTRKRRLGPFRMEAEGDRNKELGVLARAGFPRDVALRALEMELEHAEAAIREART
ncbi:MAG: hypothetical protein EXR07_02720 [Acetobacteraceae bacterium]|nr:hypothetical protein [Acetobacteraceae bacterium]